MQERFEFLIVHVNPADWSGEVERKLNPLGREGYSVAATLPPYKNREGVRLLLQKRVTE